MNGKQAASHSNVIKLFISVSPGPLCLPKLQQHQKSHLPVLLSKPLHFTYIIVHALLHVTSPLHTGLETSWPGETRLQSRTPIICASKCNIQHHYLIQVFDALRHDFNTRRRERCVRLDFPVQQGQGSIAGLEELEQLLKAAVKASFETRAAAYEEEVCAVC